MKRPLLISICLSLGFVGAVPRLVAQQPTLDADQNGLYDDAERKALMDVLAKASPALAGLYDVDNDGKVTIAEQSAGRHPISQLVPRSFVENGPKIPWAIDLFPEWLSSAYFQEDIAVDAAVAHTPRGLFVKEIAAQETDSLRPKKSMERGGVEFAANSGQFLTMAGHRDALWNYRWCIFTFRIDATSGDADETVLVDINEGRGAFRSTPKITYNKRTGLSIQYVGNNKGGLDQRVMTAQNIIADGTSWNVVVCGTRHGQMYAAVNGVALATETRQPERFSGGLAHNAQSYIGDRMERFNGFVRCQITGRRSRGAITRDTHDGGRRIRHP